MKSVEVRVETHLSNGLPAFAIVGMPETAVRESKERVRSAIINSGLDFPVRRITVNLAPADIPKSGGQYDLAIALCILVASNQAPKGILDNCEMLGELALDGTIRGVHGALASILGAKKDNRAIFLPKANQKEIDLVNYEKCHAAHSLLDLLQFLNTFSGSSLSNECKDVNELEQEHPLESPLELPKRVEDEIKGQVFAKLAVKIAAAGGHNLLMVGPPGCGKTLLAHRLMQILPCLSSEQAMDVASVRSAAGLPINNNSHLARPVRSPHHSATAVSLLGGGQKAMPGEISLAHHGILFLDELTEFNRAVLDSLREPLETGEINISRASYRICFPANFQLVAAMNPCPCGFAGDSSRSCRCNPTLIDRYLSKVSGPLLDRFDLIIELPALGHHELLLEEPSFRNPEEEQQQISLCRHRQRAQRGLLNSELNSSDIKTLSLSQSRKKTLATLLNQTGMSSRATHRIIKVAQTISDLEGADRITDSHLKQAVMLRKGGLLNQTAGQIH